jgi:hypothetical protein
MLKKSNRVYRPSFISNLTNFISLITLCCFFSTSLVAQNDNSSEKATTTARDMNVRPVEMSRTAKTSENRATTTASELQLNADRAAELDEFEVKINSLLTLVRTALVVESNAAKFHENLEQSIRMKSEQVCPSIGLMDLIKGTAPFTASPETGKQELSYAVEFLSVVLNELSAK